MAEHETLDLPPPSQSSVDLPSSSSDPLLSRNSSFSRLNAQAPEFVPSRPPPTQHPQQPQPQQPSRMVIPPPPPSMLHVYHPRPSFHVPVPPTHMVPVQNHHLHCHPHHHNHHANHHYVSVRTHSHHNQHHPYYSAGEQEVDVFLKKGDSQGVDLDGKKDYSDGFTAAANDSRNGLSDEVIQKILNQVEYYFSDLNLATTDHLMRFINKDPEGYVPISVVASFKKIKALISSNSQLATVLRNSSKIVVSEDGKKVRRQHPITELDMEELQSRIVVAENLPEDHCHQNLMKIFSAVGSVKTIRTCQPQTSNGGAPSASRLAKTDGMFFSNKLHAFVEYETIELAEKAVAELSEEGNWRSGLRVRLMLKRPLKESKPAQARGRKVHDGEGHYEEDDASTSGQQSNEKLSEDCSQQWDVHSHEHAGEELVNDKEGGQRKGRNRGRGKGRGRLQYHNNNRVNHAGSSPSNHSVISEQATVAKQPPGPRMPDGTRGFAMGRGKPVTVNIA